MGIRCLVMGDNHGDVDSLRRVLDDVGDESFDVAVHVGDFTRAWRESRQRDDERLGRELGEEQLRAVEPLLEEFEARSNHGLLWVYGNQDFFGDLEHDLTVGTEIPDDGYVTAAGQRFTSSPALVESDVVLVTHMEKWSLIDQFDGLAHFCGNTHRGRHMDDRLNAAFLQYLDPETGAKTFGGYFVVELDEDGIDVELRSIGTLERRTCERHRERGVQFQPASRDCMYCRDQRVLMREMSASAFYGLTGISDASPDDGPPDRGDCASVSVTDEALLERAVGPWDDPPTGFRNEFASYLAAVDEDRYAPLARTADGRLTLAEKSYSY